MNYYHKGLVLASLGYCLLLTPAAFAQTGTTPAFDSPEKAAKHKADFDKKVKEKKLLRNPDWYYRYKVDVTKEQELQQAGVELTAVDARAGSGTPKENLLYTDVVVRGNVISKKYDDRKDVYYHSLYEIKVEEVLHGKVKTSTIVVRLRSGKSGDGFLTSSEEPTLFLGEQVMLYLNDIDAGELAAAKAKGEWSYVNNAGKDDFNLVEKYYVKADYVFDSDDKRVEKMSKVKDDIKKVSIILDKGNFNKKSFE